MKKMMIIAAVAVAMAIGVYAEEAAPKAEVKPAGKCCGGCGGKKADVKVCADCVKCNEGAAKDAVKKLCPACQKAADEAASKAAEAAKAKEAAK
jgi:hypothetical protein